VWPPKPIEVSEPLLREAIVVMPHLRHVGHEVRTDIEVARHPDERQGELVLELQVEQVHREPLQVGVGRSPRDELAPSASPRGEGGDDAAHDEDTPEVVHHHLVPTSAKEVGQCRDGTVDAV
jgi:hypothetical protein